MKIGAIIQARVSSTRLPGKILKELPYGSGITVLQQVIRRLKRSKKLNSIIVATTVGKKDNDIVAAAKKERVKFFRGSANNVLSRYYLCAKQNNLDIIVRITSDCPCIDPKIVDSIIKEHIKTKADYTSNTLKRTFPRGLDVEVFGFDALKKSHKMAKRNYEKEHVTPYIYKNPRIFKIIQVKAAYKLRAPDIRITLDTKKDYALLSAVFNSLRGENEYFDLSDLLKLFKEKPWLRLINKDVIQKKS